MPEPVTLTPGSITLPALEALYRESPPVLLDRACRADMARAEAVVARAAAGDAAVYGVNTGFGKLASTRISPEQTAQLQRNLILSHNAGVGPDLPKRIVRLTMTLKLLSLGRGASGVQWAIVETLERMLAAGVTPAVPAQGSVGASGDLAPLAHLTAVLIGEGRADYRGERLPGGAAMQAAGIEPVVLRAKEGLALINGTQCSTALALADTTFSAGASDTSEVPVCACVSFSVWRKRGVSAARMTTRKMILEGLAVSIRVLKFIGAPS